MKTAEIHEDVRKRYGKISETSQSGSCCGASGRAAIATQVSSAIGYSNEEMAAAPEGANLGLGCGNPLALAELKAGETVVDLGSGGGFDCFLAAQRVGETGRVIGVDMTDPMLERARANAAKGGYDQVEFRKGQIEALPIDDSTVDAIISNCVINLSPDKPQVFREALRVLKPGGRVYVSDIVLTKRLPWFLRRSAALYSACVAGAMIKDEYLGAMRGAGFQEVKVVSEAPFGIESFESDPILRTYAGVARYIPGVKGVAASVVSVKVHAVKPG